MHTAKGQKTPNNTVGPYNGNTLTTQVVIFRLYSYFVLGVPCFGVPIKVLLDRRLHGLGFLISTRMASTDILGTHFVAKGSYWDRGYLAPLRTSTIL